MIAHKLPPHLQALQTPCLLLFERPFRANLDKMASHCAERGIALRPHAKTHKSAAVARAQLERGAVGICCATLAEAELLADGVDSIILTSPLPLPKHFERLVYLQRRLRELICVVDHPSALDHCERLFSREKPLDVLLDLDPGMHRTGIPMGPEALELASKLHDAPNVRFRGVQCYAGNLMHVAELVERERRALELWERVADFKLELTRRRIPCEIVSGGGTGTYDIDWRGDVATELQAGSYPFMDIEYSTIEWSTQNSPPFEPALFVLTTIVSANTAGNATTDGGLKAFATDSVLPQVHAGLEHAAKYIFKGDEHGGLLFDDSTVTVEPGTQILVSPPHCDPTINLHERFHVVDDAMQVQTTFAIDARSGRELNGG